MKKFIYKVATPFYHFGRHVAYYALLFFTHLRIHSAQCGFAIKKRKRPIKVAFMVVFESVFPLENVFRLMMEEKDFNPYIIVIPDVSRGSEHQDKTMQQTYDTLSTKYGERVLSSLVNGGFKDFCRSYDLYATMNPYSSMTHRYYRIPYLAMKGCLVFASRYFTDTGTIYSDTFNSLPALAFLWRFYAEDARDADNIRRAQPWLCWRNAVVAVGRPKMDTFKPATSCHARKCIIIAPHHSIDPIGKQRFTISNFPTYADFFLHLPKRYPSLDWVFRPHPLLFTAMVNSGRWTQVQCDAYIATMRSYANVRYEGGGEYLSTFANSDGMIQDCSSFLPEYFYTGMPQCYLLKSRETEEEQFLEYGKQLLSFTYKAYSKEDIISYIDDVVINGNDRNREERLHFSHENLMCSSRNASTAIVNDIKTAFGLIK